MPRMVVQMLCSWQGSHQNHRNAKAWNAPLCTSCGHFGVSEIELLMELNGHSIRANNLCYDILYEWVIVLRNIPSCSAS